MIKIDGDHLWRGGQKIGWVEDRHVRAEDGKHLGYFDESHIYSEEGHRLGYVEGDYLFSESGDSKIALEKISEEIVGGTIPEIGKCAVYMLLGS